MVTIGIYRTICQKVLTPVLLVSGTKGVLYVFMHVHTSVLIKSNSNAKVY